MIYRLRYCNKEGVEARVDIQKGSSTHVIEVEGTERPFILSYNNDKGDKSGMFLSSSADIEIYETPEFNIDNLKTSNETELSVTHYIDNVITWQGFIIPDFFSIEVRNNPVITMTASDRLGTLKNVTLSDLPSMISLRELAILCLSKTGLELPLKTMADFSNGTGVNDFFNSKILTQRLSDTKGRSISCYDILSSILTASNSKLLQRGGEWVIINKVQHEAGSGKLYTGATSFINWSDVIFNFSDISVGGRRTIVPVASTVGVFHEFGGGKMYPENYDFSQGLSGWTENNGFEALIGNKKFDKYKKEGDAYVPDYSNIDTNSYLINRNYLYMDVAGHNGQPRLSATNIPIISNNPKEVKVTFDVNVTGKNNTHFSVAVVLSTATGTMFLNNDGIFQKTYTVIDVSIKDESKGDLDAILKGRLISATIKADEEEDVSNYKLEIHIFGSGSKSSYAGGEILFDTTVIVNSITIKYSTSGGEIPKGNIYKTEKGDNFTKTHDIETAIFGDYLTGGLNGYFYDYPIDDTSSLYNSSNELTSKWTAYNDPEQLPLLQHVSRQKSRLFSVAHDLLSAEIEVDNFDPLAIFVSCSKRYTVVSAQFDFFKSNLSVELEEVAFKSATVRDFIYSYFGDGESGIKSIGGISGGSGIGTGSGLTPEQLDILSRINTWWKYDEEDDKIYSEFNVNSKQKLSADESIEIGDFISGLNGTGAAIENINGTTKEEVDELIVRKTANIDELFIRRIANIFSILTEKGIEIGNFVSGLNGTGAAIKNNEGISEAEIDKLLVRQFAEIFEILSEKGIEIGEFSSGLLGTGAAIKNINGTTIAEVDQLLVRQRAEFFSVLMHRAESIGGQLIISAANMLCTKVEETTSFYRCYFDSKGGEVINLFSNQDFARCQVFTGTRQKFYWRRVVAVGDDYIELSKTDAAPNSDVPEVGDTIFQLGSLNENRQSAIILSTVGNDAPSFIQYAGIDSYTLEGKEVTKFTRLGNEITGKTVIRGTGKNVEQIIEETEENIQQVFDDVLDINLTIGNLQAQIDGEVSNWFYPYSPTLTNYPASEWTTIEEKDRHIGDTFTNTQEFIDNDTTPDAGKSWRFVKEGDTYKWTPIADSDAVKALLSASQAQDTADGKSTTYLVQPSSYNIGDLWVLENDKTINGVAYKQGDVLTALQNSETFNQSHWTKKIRYTDDTAVENIEIGGRNLILNSLNRINLYSNDSSIFPIQNEAVTDEDYRRFRRTYPEGITNTDISTYTKEFFTPDKSGHYTYSMYFRPNDYNIELRLRFGDIYGSYKLCKAGQWTQISVTAYIEAGVETRLDGVWGTMPPEFVQWIDYNRVKVEKGNKATDWTPAPEDVQAEIEAVEQAAEAAATAAQEANTAVEGLNTYVNEAFHDGIIKESEAKAIEKYINIVNTEKANLEATYNTLYANPYLEGTAKTNLLNAKITYFGAVDNLINAINIAIEDDKVDLSEKQNVDNKYASYKDALASLQTAIENANKAIQTKLDELSTEKVEDIEIGGRNLLSGTKDFSTVSTPSFVTEETYLGFKVIHGSYLGLDYVDICAWYNAIIPEPNQYYTLSFYCKGIGVVESYFAPNACAENYSSDGYHGTAADGYTPIQLTSEWRRVWIVFKTRDDVSGLKHLYVMRLRTDGEGYICGVMFEKGNKPTDWTPAPEDVEAEIDEVRGDVDSIADEIRDNLISDKYEVTFEGGLIQSFLLELKDLPGDPTAGMSGVQGTGKDYPAFWAGGTYNDAFDGIAKAIIKHNGKAIFEDAEIRGTIEALSGTIGGMTIEDDCLTSQDGNMILSGEYSSIELISEIERYTSNGDIETIEQTISLKSINGKIESYSDYDIAYISSQGIFANRAGIQALPATSGIELKAAVVALGFGNLKKDAYSNKGAICGVYGSSVNNNSDPAPSYGGYFNILQANGLYLNCRQINSSATLTQNDVIISLYNTSTITITLPAITYVGQLIMLRFNNSYEIILSGNGNHLLIPSGEDVTSITVGTRGEIVFLTWDGQYWLYSTTQQ